MGSSPQPPVDPVMGQFGTRGSAVRPRRRGPPGRVPVVGCSTLNRSTSTDPATPQSSAVEPVLQEAMSEGVISKPLKSLKKGKTS